MLRLVVKSRRYCSGKPPKYSFQKSGLLVAGGAVLWVTTPEWMRQMIIGSVLALFEAIKYEIKYRWCKLLGKDPPEHSQSKCGGTVRITSCNSDNTLTVKTYDVLPDGSKKLISTAKQDSPK